MAGPQHIKLQTEVTCKAGTATPLAKPQQQQRSQPNEALRHQHSEPVTYPQEYSITSVEIVAPASGFREEHPYAIRGAITRNANTSTITIERITLDVYTAYKGTEKFFRQFEAFLQSDDTFGVEVPKLHHNNCWCSDKEKATDATYELYVVAKSNAAPAECKSAAVSLPVPSQFIDLRRKHYDDVYADKKGLPKSGNDYVPDNLVSKLQKDLITLGYLASGLDTGYYYDLTRDAVNAFIGDVNTGLRVKRNQGLQIEEKAQFISKEPDGVVCEKTRKEISHWLTLGYVKPAPTVREGDRDQEAVRKGLCEKTDPDVHAGNPVKELQQNLVEAGAYDGKVDGSFGPKTREAILLFQKCAANGKFLVDGILTEIGEKLQGYLNGAGDPPTKEMVKAVVAKGGKVPEPTAVTYFFPLDKKYQDKGYHSGMRAFGSSRSKGTRHHAGCDLYAPLASKVYAVADGKITAYYNYYWKTFALEVDHGDFVALYGEVQPAVDPKKHGAVVTKEVMDYIGDLKDQEKRGLPGALKIGSTVKKGEHIGYVGQLYENNSTVPHKNTMVHFEKFRKTAIGQLTQKNYAGKYEYVDDSMKSCNFMRRKDLENPTSFLDGCVFVG